MNGRDLRSLSVRERARKIAYIPQSHSSVYDYDVLDAVLMSASGGVGMFGSPKKRHVERAWEALERVGVAHLGHRPYTRISGGEKQLVLIARAIAQDARTIVMDEPTSALDYGNTVRVLSAVRQLAREGMSIVQSTHQPDQAFLYADRTLVLNEGRVCAYGNPKDVVTKELVSAIYHVDVEVCSLYGDKVRVCVPVANWTASKQGRKRNDEKRTDVQKKEGDRHRARSRFVLRACDRRRRLLAKRARRPGRLGGICRRAAGRRERDPHVHRLGGRTVEVPAQIDRIAPAGHTATQVLLTMAPENTRSRVPRSFRTTRRSTWAKATPSCP